MYKRKLKAVNNEWKLYSFIKTKKRVPSHYIHIGNILYFKNL